MKVLGNAVSVPVAEWIGRQILKAAAPDLLDVCQRPKQAHERGLIHPPDDLSLVPACLAALDKAMGGKP
jgi:hypothetical protein